MHKSHSHNSYDLEFSEIYNNNINKIDFFNCNFIESDYDLFNFFNSTINFLENNYLERIDNYLLEINDYVKSSPIKLSKSVNNKLKQISLMQYLRMFSFENIKNNISILKIIRLQVNIDYENLINYEFSCDIYENKLYIVRFFIKKIEIQKNYLEYYIDSQIKFLNLIYKLEKLSITIFFIIISSFFILRFLAYLFG